MAAVESRLSPRRSLLLWLLIQLLFHQRAVASPELAYVQTLSVDDAEPLVVIDTRPLAQCLKRSLKGARCLPADEFLNPAGRLASFRDILWVFGTARLSGMETVWIGGDEPRRRDFMAGLLYLGGQARVMVLEETMSGLLARSEIATGAGVTRGLIRDPIYQGQVRDERIVLGHELREALAGSSVPAIMDGRTERERRDATVTGSIPGAQSFPADRLRAGGMELAPFSAIVYAGDPFDSIAYFVFILAATEIDARVYVQGWREWSARYTDFIEVDPAGRQSNADATTRWRGIGFALLALAVGLALAGVVIGRRRR